MMNQSKKKFLVVGILGAFLVLVFLSFTLLSRAGKTTSVDLPSSVTLQPLTAWTDDLVLKPGELPSGWQLGKQGWRDLQGMPSRSYWFVNSQSQQAGATLSNDLAVYSTTEQAKLAYPHILDEFFPPAYAKNWKTMPELAIQDHADEIKTACLPGAQFTGSPNVTCSSIARYQNVIVQVNGVVLPERWLTLSDFRQMLEAVDRRITKVLAQLP